MPTRNGEQECPKMRKPRALALFCLGATTTTTSTTSVSGFQALVTRIITSPRPRGRGNGSGSSGVHRGSRRYLAKRRAPGLRHAAPAGGEDNNYGGEDYSEYGYEPDHELQDEEQLEKWRTERLLVNDRWQFGMYGKQNVGNWLGMWQEYVAQELEAGSEPEGDDAEDSVIPMVGIVPGKHFSANTRISRRLLEFAEGVKVFEHQHQPLEGVPPGEFSCPDPVVETLFTDSFRGGNGTQVAGNTYTMAMARPPAAGAGPPEDLGDVWVELGLREGDVRMRTVFQYSRAAEGANLRRVFLVREGLERLPAGDGAIEPELYGSAGKGLYDTPPRSRSPLYFSIYAEGGLTLRFPMIVEAGQAGVFSVDWTAGDMRYQADRVFDVLDGSCRRLEVTQIGTQDAEIFLPLEKF